MGLELVRIISVWRSVAAGANWRIPVVLSIAAVVLGLLGAVSLEQLRFDRYAIADGELWRLATGHLVHLGWSHLTLNIAGLLLVWVLVGDQYSTRQWVIILLVSAIGVSGGLWFLDTNLTWYVGLSGVLHGLLVAGVLPGVSRGTGESIVVLLFVVAKLGYEQWAGPMPGSEGVAGGQVVVNSHLYGAAGGILAGLALLRSVRRDAPI